MSQTATPATQNDRTTSLETFEKERFCSFPHRHGDATRKPATRDETRKCEKTSISYETSGNFQSWHHDKKTILEDVLQFSWQAQHFGRVHCHFSWQAQHFRRVLLRVFRKSHWHGCVKWRQGANSVAGVAFSDMC